MTAKPIVSRVGTDAINSHGKGQKNAPLPPNACRQCGQIDGEHLAHCLLAERDALRQTLERINLRFYNFDNQHPSLATNEAARQLLADIEADISGTLAKARA